MQGSNLNRNKTSFCSQNAQTNSGAHQPPIHRILGFFLAIKRIWHEVIQPSAPSVRVKNEWSFTSSPPICLHGIWRDSFAFTSVACAEKYKSLCNLLKFFFTSFLHLNILLSSDSRQKGSSQKVMKSATGLQWASPYRQSAIPCTKTSIKFNTFQTAPKNQCPMPCI